MKKIRIALKIAALVVPMMLLSHFIHSKRTDLIRRPLRSPEQYAIIACDTPDGTGHREYDYAFYLPLTALAWQRIGFKCAVLIIGSRKEWEDHAVLRHVLHALESQHAVVVFLNAPTVNRRMLSQTARIFAANINEFHFISEDYLITSDSDLWQLHREHFPPEVGKKLVLVHSNCCGQFSFKNRSYRMVPMSNIGASVATWQQVINDNHTTAFDAESILSYFQDEYGPSVRENIVFASENWFLDQKLVSVRVQQWVDVHSDQLVFEKSDWGYARIDRIAWMPQLISPSSLGRYFDAHMPVNGYDPVTWSTIKPLVHLVYGKSSWQAEWADQYAREFFALVKHHRKRV